MCLPVRNNMDRSFPPGQNTMFLASIRTNTAQRTAITDSSRISASFFLFMKFTGQIRYSPSWDRK